MGAIPPIRYFNLYPVLCIALSIAHGLLPEQIRANLLLALASAALTLSVVDLAARSPLISPRLSNGRWPPLPVLNRWPANVERRYTTYGDMTRLLGTYRYGELQERVIITDAYGFRNEDGNPPQIDWIALGDSYTVGAISQHEAWPILLAEQRGEHVYNLGMSGTSPWQQYVTLAVEMPRLRRSPLPAVIWMLFTGNDLAEIYLQETDIDELDWNVASEYPQTYYLNFRDQSPVGAVLARLVTHPQQNVMIDSMPGGEPILFYQPYLANAVLLERHVRNNPKYKALLLTLHAARLFAEEQGLPLYVVIAPTKEEVYRWVWEDEAQSGTDAPISMIGQMMLKAAQEEGLCVLDLAPIFDAEARRLYVEEGQLLWWRDDSHWNLRGNRLAAESIGEWLDAGTCE
jgi:hypothetical protein